MKPTSEGRAARAVKALDAGGYKFETEGRDAIVDCIVDLLHLASNTGEWDIDGIIRVAVDHHDAEQEKGELKEEELSPWPPEVEEAAEKKGLWWLSFADALRGFLGVAIVEAHGFIGAIVETLKMDLNPGGEVKGCPLPQDFQVPEEAKNRLLSEEDIGRLLPGKFKHTGRQPATD